jgi:hypothetical protein
MVNGTRSIATAVISTVLALLFAPPSGLSPRSRRRTRDNNERGTTMRKKLIAAGLVGLTFVLSAPLATGVAHAGCTGSVLQHNWRCDCNPGAYWDPSLNECQVTQAWIDANAPRGPWPVHTCQTASCVP